MAPPSSRRSLPGMVARSRPAANEPGRSSRGFQQGLMHPSSATGRPGATVAAQVQPRFWGRAAGLCRVGGRVQSCNLLRIARCGFFRGFSARMSRRHPRNPRGWNSPVWARRPDLGPVQKEGGESALSSHLSSSTRSSLDPEPPPRNRENSCETVGPARPDLPSASGRPPVASPFDGRVPHGVGGVGSWSDGSAEPSDQSTRPSKGDGTLPWCPRNAPLETPRGGVVSYLSSVGD